MRHCVLVAVILSLIALTIPIWGQSPTATANGLVRDPSGAVVPGADLQLINEYTNVKYQAKTNNEGIYSVSNLPPGTYRIQVSKIGFKTIVKPDIVLNVLDARAINFDLPVGAVSETVTVEGGASLVDTESATVSTVVDRQFAENLPMNGRSFQTLIQLTPGVVLTPSNTSDAGQFSVNGQRAASNYWTVDGVSANIGVGAAVTGGNGLGGSAGSFSAQGGTNSLVSVDALQEFRIQTSTYAPEFGRTPGGQISIVTRSGANQFHGSAFDYFRNDALDASDWFNGYINVPPLRKARERQNDFGGTFSGPILRNRAFFFFSYEGLRLRLPETRLTTVPCDSSCAVGGDARGSAVPAMQPFLKAFPVPNGPEVFEPCNPLTDPACPPSGQKATGSAVLNASFSNPSTLDAYSLRIDHKLKDKLSFFGRYNHSPSEIVNRGGQSSVLSVLQPSRISTRTATLGATWVRSSTITNDLRFNYSRTNSSSSFTLDNFGGAVPLTSLPFPGRFTHENAMLALVFFPLKNGNTLRTGASVRNLQRQINLVDNLSVQTGSHMLKFGLDFRRLSPLAAPALYVQGAVFADVLSSETGSTVFGSVNSFADVTLGFHNLSIFAQDTWRMASRLTVTYGLRWDLDVSPSSLQGPSIAAVTGYDLNDFSRLAIAPAGSPPFRTTYGNVAPRFGLAYQLSQNQNWGTVLRGGLGVFYDLASSETGNLVGTPFSPFGAGNAVTGTFPFDPVQVAPPVIPAPDISNVYAFNPKLRLPYTLGWNISLEQALGGLQSVSASYVGARGRRLIQTTQVISPPTNSAVFGAFIDNTAVSSYDALQVQLHRRLSHNLQVLSSYTWAHSIDTGSAGSTKLASNLGVPGGNSNANRGPSDFDIRTGFSVGLTYDFGAPKAGAIADALLGGWSIQGVIQARSAPPVDVFDSAFQGFNNGNVADIRPDLIPGRPFYLYGTQYPGGKALNPAAFEDPPFDPNTFLPLRQGNVARNLLRGFGATQVDFAVHRDFPIHEALKLQFRAEMFNVLNHPNFGPPSGSFLSPTFGGPAGFGLSTQTLGHSLDVGNAGGGAFSALYQIGGPRSIQVALKLLF